MPYLAATELTLVLPAGVSIGTNTTPLTIGEVGSIVARVSAELDAAAAAAGYTVPVSASVQAYAQMQQYTLDGAGWMVLRTIFPNLGGTADKSSLASDYRQAYMDALAAIRSGTLPLVGAGDDTGETVRLLPRSFETSHPGATLGGASPIVSLYGWTP